MNKDLNLSRIGEFGLIDMIRKMTGPNPRVLTGIGDDAAVLSSSAGKQLLFTTDMLIEDIHFHRRMGGRAIGRKALAVNLSDIAAMGGRPTFGVVSLGVPSHSKVGFIREMYAGILELAEEFQTAVVGGDTNRSERLIINISLLGEAERRNVVLRSGARIGDWIWVTGPLGRSFPTGKHLWFQPRMREAQFLVENFKPAAMIDISDGLAADLGHILKASGVGACLDAEQIPLARGATLNEALGDGEDFELLFILPPRSGKKMLSLPKKPFAFYRIGEIVGKKQGLTLRDSQGRLRPLSARGFQHF